VLTDQRAVEVILVGLDDGIGGRWLSHRARIPYIVYFPSRDDWQTQRPAELGMTAEGLAAAIAYHRAHETSWRRDFLTESGRYLGVNDEPPAPGDELGYAEKGRPRPPRPPGTLWEYNDVRVNRLALSLLQVFRRPLPDVLHEAVMEPLGASSSWEWQPYGNSWVEMDGVRMPSVPGG